MVVTTAAPVIAAAASRRAAAGRGVRTCKPPEGGWALQKEGPRASEGLPGLLNVVSPSPALRGQPAVDVLAHLVLGLAVALLDLAFELVAAAADDVKIVVGQLTPLLLDLALDLL